MTPSLPDLTGGSAFGAPTVSGGTASGGTGGVGNYTNNVAFPGATQNVNPATLTPAGLFQNIAILGAMAIVAVIVWKKFL